MVKISQISEPYISWIYEFQLLSLTLALVHNAQNFDQGIDYLWTSLTAGKVHCLKSQGWNRQISHCTFECKHGTYDSLLPNSVPVVSRYVTFSPFSTLPPSVLHNIPHNLRQLLSFGLCHVGLLFFFHFCCLIWNVLLSSYFSLFALLSFCPPVPFSSTCRLYFSNSTCLFTELRESPGRAGLLTVLEVKTSPLCGLIMGQTGWRRVKGTHVHKQTQTHAVALFKLVLKGI